MIRKRSDRLETNDRHCKCLNRVAKAYRMVSFNLKDGCSLGRARKIFATACQMLVLAKINTLLACSQMLAKTIL